MNRVFAMARKEVYHILRDRRSLGVAILMPLFMVMLFGFAIDMELKHLPVAILDQDESPASRELIRQMTSGNFIDAVQRLRSRHEVEHGFRQGHFRAAVIIPRGFARQLERNPTAPVQVLIDGADATTAATVDNYLSAVLQLYTRQRQFGADGSAAALVDPRLRIDFNPELESAYFVVPGLVAVILMMICALLTSIALARERESGTLEQVLTTPVTAWQVIAGKLLPYVGLGAIDAALVLGVGRVVFGVPLAGSWMVLAAYSLVYVLIALSLGLLISAVSRSQRAAMMIAVVATYLPSLLLSGFIFELGSMPWPLRWLGHIIPATHYIRVIHGVMLKGQAWFPQELAIMSALLLVLTVAATRRFRATLE